MFSLPVLLYALDALEPHISADIMDVHYNKHHQGYLTKLNTALEGTEFEGETIENLLSNLEYLPDTLTMTVRNNGGGYYNHSLFWEEMTPEKNTPSKNLDKLLSKHFGSFKEFQEKFENLANTLFGSGWVWLTLVEDSLEIHQYTNQDNPIMQGDTPILGLDVWEHAYYLQYHNRRPEYVSAFWNLVDWAVVEKRIMN